MPRKKNLFTAVALIALLFALFYLIQQQKQERQALPIPYQYNQGPVFGSTYHIKYKSATDYQAKIDSILRSYNACMSSYETNSLVSRINRNDTAVILNDWFITAFNVAKKVSENSNGDYDITVAPLVNAWGFGFSKKAKITDAYIKELLPLIDYRKIEIRGNQLFKKDPRIMLDMSSLGDGYAADIVSDFLESKGVTDFMVEIAGEVRVKGKNGQGKIWSIGINKPIDDTAYASTELEQVVGLGVGALSTSGNYHNFYYKDGKKYAHTIDPHTGYPVQHTLLSATIIAPTCIEADAYSTACMVMGLEKSLQMIKRLSHLQGYFIYNDDNDSMRVVYTDGMKKMITQ